MTMNEGKVEGLLVSDYFSETDGEIHEWRHLRAPPESPTFRVPRFLRPLSAWINKLIEAGFSIEEIEEPSASKDVVNQYPELITTRMVAHSLIIRVKKNNEFPKSLKEITEKLPGNVWWKDKNLKYLGCNDRVIDVLGLSSRKDFIGKTDYDLWEKSLAKKLEEADKYILDSGETINLEEKIADSNGRIVTMLTNKSPLNDVKGNVIGILGTSTDITELKKTQSQLKKTEGRLDGMLLLSASIAHELRTPLASIRAGVYGILDLLPKLFEGYRQAKKHGLMIPIPEKLLNSSQDSLQRIDNSARQAHQIIDMILMSISADENNLKRSDTCSIKKCIDTAISEYIFQPGKIKLVHIKEIKDFNFYGSEIQIKHVIFNLLRNALYFIEKVGKGEIFLWTGIEEKFNKLHFKDTGQGISEQTLPKIFNRFFTEGSHRGTGIGLSFCKMVMENLGGKIECHSRLNEYTEFILYFPK